MKEVVASQALAELRAGMRVGLGGGSATPVSLLQELPARMAEISGLTIVSGPLYGGYELLQHLTPGNRYESWFLPAALVRQRLDSRLVRHLPLSWYQACQYLQARPVDVALIQVAPSEREGFVSLGTSCGYVRPMIDTAKLVIAEVNDRMPYTFGSSEISQSRVDMFVKVSHPLAEAKSGVPKPSQAAIVQRCVELLLDASALQVGVGSIGSAVVAELYGRGFTGVLYSLLNDGFLQYRPSRRSQGPAATVGEIVGSTELYSAVHLNESVHMLSGVESHSPESLMCQKGLSLLNSALEVDLFGQVNAEFLDSQLVGGGGGAVDFMSADASVERRSIVALASSAGADHRLSRIVPLLQCPSVATRFQYRSVVTEFGAWSHSFESSWERAEGLIGLAAPEHRPGLSSFMTANRHMFGGAM